MELMADALEDSYKFFNDCKSDKFGRMRPTKAQGEQAWYFVSKALAEYRKMKGE